MHASLHQIYLKSLLEQANQEQLKVMAKNMARNVQRHVCYQLLLTVLYAFRGTLY